MGSLQLAFPTVIKVDLVGRSGEGTTAVTLKTVMDQIWKGFNVRGHELALTVFRDAVPIP